MFLDVAHELGTVQCGGVVVRTPRPLEVPSFTSLDACLREVRPDFVLTATPWSVTPAFIAESVDRGVPVLAETPPAPDLDGLRALWSAVGASGLVQVAEQYLMMPSHAARAAVVASGALGTPTQVQVSSTQQYHAVSLIRGLLGAGRGPVSVRASRFTAPLVSPLSRTGWTDDEEPHPTNTTIATLDFGDGRSGVYDFTDQQTRNWLRVCCSVKSYTPERPSPKSRVAIVVVVGCGSSSSVQPVRLSGLTNGALNRLARTETGPRPAPSRPRISDTA